MKPGDIVHIWLESEHLSGQDAKFKYGISVDPVEKRLLLINSEIRRITPDQNLAITNKEAPFLPNETSFIDTSRLIGLTSGQFSEAMRKPGAKLCGTLSLSIVARLLPVVEKSKGLPGWQKKLIAKHLGQLASRKK